PLSRPATDSPPAGSGRPGIAGSGPGAAGLRRPNQSQTSPRVTVGNRQYVAPVRRPRTLLEAGARVHSGVWFSVLDGCRPHSPGSSTVNPTRRWQPHVGSGLAATPVEEFTHQPKSAAGPDH